MATETTILRISGKFQGGSDDFISSVLSICDCVKAKREEQNGSIFPLMNGMFGITAMKLILSWKNGVQAPHRLEDVYNF